MKDAVTKRFACPYNGSVAYLVSCRPPLHGMDFPDSSAYFSVAPMPPAYRLAKRALDVTGAIVGLLVLLPLCAVVALLVASRRDGPIFHRRRVLARQAVSKQAPLRTFDAYKFRTMRVDADAVLLADAALRREFEKEWKLSDDPRVTPLGKVLRKWSVDELPQLVNVLRGQMSLVGPRMIAPGELAKYGPFAPALLSAKPGLTGLWQVSGRTHIAYEERVRLDMLYLQTRSLAFDVEILWRTLPAVLSRNGAQ